MSKKLKKQKRKMTLVITSILLVVWLVVSGLFSYIVLNNEKDSLISKEQQSFSRLISRIEDYMFPTYGSISLCLEHSVEHYDYYVIDDEQTPTLSYGAYPVHDNSVHIVAFSTIISQDEDSEIDVKNTLIMDTDKYDYSLFACTNDEHTFREGKIEYDSFKSSVNEKDYKEICDYLYKKIDEKGNYYLLTCTQFYYTSPGVITPKTVQIIKYNDKDEYFEKAEVIKQYELSPEDISNASLFVNDDKTNPNIIPGDFVVGNYSSGGLIDDIYNRGFYDEKIIYNGNVEQTGMFTYTFENIDTLYIGMVSEQYQNDFLEEYIQMGPESLQNEIITVHYKRAFDVLASCKEKLLTGLVAIFLFFFIIGLVLVICTRRILTAQLREEEKRIQVTNALAHDIKTPLFKASGYAQNLAEDVNSDKRDHYAKKIIEQTNEINELVHKMLDFSNIDNIEHSVVKEDIDLCEITQNVVSDYGNLHKIRINVKYSQPCIVNADRNLMTRAVSYLVDNAVKYSEPDSEIDISVSKDNFVISNRCSNLTNDDMKHIFEPYYKVDKNRSTKGNGLGLSIVKSTVELHSFRISAKLDESVVTFTISFS